MNIVQGTTLTFLQADYLETKKAVNVASGTLTFYNQKLLILNNYCLTQKIKTISQISPSTIREYLLFLRERGHNDGGVHGQCTASEHLGQRRQFAKVRLPNI